MQTGRVPVHFMHSVNLGLIGGGTVGTGVWTTLQRNGLLLGARLGVEFRISRVAVRSLEKARPVEFPLAMVTDDWRSVVEDPAVQVIVELVGGKTVAREIVIRALELGKPVVTANKALLSAFGEELFATAARHGTNLYYEASVAGGVPIIKVIRESMVGNRILQIAGIVNGTCNYILTRMKLEGADLSTVLMDAQRLGYAEAEPSLDIDGHDAAHKTGILASLAHGFWVRPETIHTEGIREVTPLDIQFADRLGYTIKLLGMVKELTRETGEKNGQKAIQVAVYPALVPNRHVLASVNHAFNAIAVTGDVVGETLYYGRGAGADPTASSVLSDLADAALDLMHGCRRRVPPFVPHAREANLIPMAEVVSRYYVRLLVLDRPGVFAGVANILARAQIGISSIIQPEGHAGEVVPVILMIHDATNAAMQKVLLEIEQLPMIKAKPVMFRVEPFE